MHKRFVFVLLLACSWGGTVDAAAQFPAYRAAIGMRGGFAGLGGDQFHTLSSGLAFEGFLRVPFGEYFSVEMGASAAVHRKSFLCAWPQPCLEPRESVIGGLFVAPGVRHAIPGTAVVGYGALQTGLLFGSFQDEGPGVELGLVLGSAFPLYRNLSADVSVLGSLVHVGTDVPRSAYGRRLVVRVGFAYALRDAVGG